MYTENQKEINEEGAVDASHELISAEELLKQKVDQNLTILRCGGMMGYERIPGKYFAGKKDLPGGNNPVNYVHRDDVLRAIVKIVENEVYGNLFNVVAPFHPLKKEVIKNSALDFNMELPHFKEENAFGYKIVNSDKLIKSLNFEFQYPDPLSFYYNNLA